LNEFQHFRRDQLREMLSTLSVNRNTLFLLKLSIFSLPLGFKMSYFSVQIPEPDDSWSATTYLYTFAVIASLAFLGLFFLSRLIVFLTDVMDDWAMWMASWLQSTVELPVELKAQLTLVY
jgi:hypothetical protein